MSKAFEYLEPGLIYVNWKQELSLPKVDEITSLNFKTEAYFNFFNHQIKKGRFDSDLANSYVQSKINLIKHKHCR